MSEWQPGMTLEQVEKMTIQKALRFYQGNQERTARALGISTKTIYNKIRQYEGKGIDDGSIETERPKEPEIQVETRLHMEPNRKVSKKSAMPLR